MVLVKEFLCSSSSPQSTEFGSVHMWTNADRGRTKHWPFFSRKITLTKPMPEMYVNQKKKKKIQSNFFLYVPHKEKWVWPRKRRGPLCANLANYRPLMDHILRCTCYSLLVGRPTFLATCPPRVNPFVEHNILIWSKIDGLVRSLDWRWPKSPDDTRCQHLVQQAAGV